MYPELYPELDGRSKKLEFSRLTTTAETGSGVEIASFEVQNPQAFEHSLISDIAKITS